MRHESWNLTGQKKATPDTTEANEALADEFDAWAAAGRGDSMETGHGPTARQALERVPWAGTRSFLDVGCGNGYAVRFAAERIGARGEAMGLDVSPEMIRQATAKSIAWAEAEPGRADNVAPMRFIEAPFDAMPIEDGEIDVVFSNEAIYYAPDIDAALAEILRVMRPGGHFLCGIDFYQENTHSHNWPEKVGVPMLMDSEDGWADRLTKAGFEDISTARLLDPNGADEKSDDPTHAAWKKEIGTLLLTGRRSA